VRDRPIDPMKLQEEMKRKGFRIEYEDQKPRTPNPHRKSRNKSHSETKVLDFNDFLEKRKDKVILNEYFDFNLFRNSIDRLLLFLVNTF